MPPYIITSRGGVVVVHTLCFATRRQRGAKSPSEQPAEPPPKAAPTKSPSAGQSLLRPKAALKTAPSDVPASPPPKAAPKKGSKRALDIPDSLEPLTDAPAPKRVRPTAKKAASAARTDGLEDTVIEDDDDEVSLCELAGTAEVSMRFGATSLLVV